MPSTHDYGDRDNAVTVVATLILICGLPGAGKTTLARRMATERGAIRLCPDEWLTSIGIDLHHEEARDRLERVLTAHARDLLVLGQTVILEYGFWARTEREALRAMAREVGVRVELHALIVPVDELWRRIMLRTTDPPWGVAQITRDQLTTWAGLFQAPDAAEVEQFDTAPPTSGRSLA